MQKWFYYFFSCGSRGQKSKVGLTGLKSTVHFFWMLKGGRIHLLSFLAPTVCLLQLVASSSLFKPTENIFIYAFIHLGMCEYEYVYEGTKRHKHTQESLLRGTSLCNCGVWKSEICRTGLLARTSGAGAEFAVHGRDLFFLR